MGKPLRFRDFRLLFTGETISVVGDYFHFVALAWLTLQLTGSGLALGSVLMVAAIPRAVFMVVGGALSDRWSPRSLMLYSNAVRAVLVGFIAALVLTGQIQLWHLYLMGAAFGLVDALFYPAINSIVPMLVDEEALPPANALLQGSQQLAGLIGPAIAGFVVALVQTGPAFAVDAVSFAVAATALLFVVGGRRPPKASGEEHPSLLGSIRAGVGYAWGDPAVRSLLLLTAAFNFAFNGPILVGLPFLADHVLGGGSATFGILLSAFGGGAVVGAVAAGRRVPRLGTIVLTTATGMGVALGLMGVAPNIPTAFAMLGAMGLGAGFLNVHIISWLQGRTAAELRGRVMSIVMLGSIGLAPVSYALAGAIVDFGAVAVMYAVAGAIVVAAS
ncbi:MAG: MFS transporter, partial [Candidatus Limnocylindria bacterium]